MTNEQEKKWSEWAEFQEVMKLVSAYDWAVEGGYPPAGQNLTRSEAAALRTKLLNILKED